jgi:hypothetical protein
VASEAYGLFSIAIFALATAPACGVEVGVVATSIKSGSESEPEPKASSSLSRALLWSSRRRMGEGSMCVEVAGSVKWRWLSKKTRVQQSVKGRLTVWVEVERRWKVGASGVELVSETWGIEAREKSGSDDLVNDGSLK